MFSGKTGIIDYPGSDKNGVLMNMTRNPRQINID